MTVRVAQIHVYPLKSAGGVAVDEVAVDEVGLRHDRRFMLLDEEGRFLTQRTHPRMALLRTSLLPGLLRISAPASGCLDLPLPGAGRAGRRRAVAIWGEERTAGDCGDAAAAWASAFMGLPCRIVEAIEPADGRRLSASGRVRAGFADAEPSLLISTASLDGLNARLAAPVPMDRFRPNLVVTGVEAHAEDGWSTLRVGDVPARVSRPCPRCSLPTVDQETGRKDGTEPLRTLATYRRSVTGEVMFGVHAHFQRPGIVRVGDPIVPEG